MKIEINKQVHNVVGPDINPLAIKTLAGCPDTWVVSRVLNESEDSDGSDPFFELGDDLPITVEEGDKFVVHVRVGTSS